MRDYCDHSVNRPFNVRYDQALPLAWLSLYPDLCYCLWLLLLWLVRVAISLFLAAMTRSVMPCGWTEQCTGQSTSPHCSSIPVDFIWILPSPALFT